MSITSSLYVSVLQAGQKSPEGYASIFFWFQLMSTFLLMSQILAIFPCYDVLKLFTSLGFSNCFTVSCIQFCQHEWVKCIGNELLELSLSRHTRNFFASLYFVFQYLPQNYAAHTCRYSSFCKVVCNSNWVASNCNYHIHFFNVDSTK